MPHDVVQIPQHEPDARTPEALATAVRDVLFRAMKLLDEMGTPIELLIAHQAQKRPDLLIRARSRFAATPKNDVPVGVAALHLAALRALATQGAVIIDQSPVSIAEWAA